MKYFIVAMMSLVSEPLGQRDMYVFTKPFDSLEECKTDASINMPYIMAKLWNEYGQHNENNYPLMISCIDQYEVKKLEAHRTQDL